ncbi:MAG: dTDP-4-dehydrorhamnose reductase [Celeribacter sp.]|jgi:dTDP-4-dehydrorhamnose reductase
MTVLVFGHSGQVATELRRQAGARDSASGPVSTLARNRVRTLRRDHADLSDPAACAAAIHAHAPRAVINAAAYTAVDAAEGEEARATVINAHAPAAMARACAALDIPFVHISTDYVFDGTGTEARTPADRPAPQNAYGRSKLAGEEAVRQAMAGRGARYAILRTSWVFSAHGANFVKTMLRLSDCRDRLSVVGDQIGGPTSARAIAAACLEIAEQLMDAPGKSGLYHFSGAPDVSWHGFAAAIYAAAGRQVRVDAIPTAEYPTPAARPLNSRLDCSLSTQVFGLTRPDWRRELTHILPSLLPPILTELESPA